jgi:hypothetical protein
MRNQRTSLAKETTKTLDWEILEHPVHVNGNTADRYKGFVRSDNNELLSVTSATYQPCLNEQFVNTVSRLHEITGFDIHGYSEFQGGRKVMAYLKNTEPKNIAGFPTDSYMVLGNSFDKTTTFFVGLSNIVIRCTNAFSRIKVGLNIRHNSQLSSKLDDLVRYYQNYISEQERLTSTFEVWQGIKISAELKEMFADHVLDVKEENELSTFKKHQKEILMDSIEKETSEMGHNMYGLFNGLTHYTTHRVLSSNKVFGNSLGHTARLNEKGFVFASKYAESVV